jgi:hypothetical protein
VRTRKAWGPMQIPSERTQRTTDRALIADDPFPSVNQRYAGAAHSRARRDSPIGSAVVQAWLNRELMMTAMD